MWLSLLAGGLAQAATINFNGGTASNCYRFGTTYYCNTGFIGANDTAAIASGYTVYVFGDVTLAYAQGLRMTGTARLESSGNIDLSASNNLAVNGGSIVADGNFKLGASAQAITANISADTVTTAGASTSITGTVTASGAITLGSNSTITGAVSGASISTGSATTLGGALTVTGLADLGSGIKVAGGVTAGSVRTGSPAQISGGIVADTTIALGSGATVTGNVSGTVVTTTSAVNITGAVTATTSFQLASGSTVTGNIKAPTVQLDAANVTIKGNIDAATRLDIGSGANVTGNLTGGALVLRASGVTVNGSVTMTGDADIGAGTTINGDFRARDVITRAENAIINGNAAVNKIYLDWGARVTKTITCTGTGAVGCSCVTKADPNYFPTCAASTTAVHHIQITHGGNALTCQPQAVTLTACANAACTAPHSSASVNVTLQPGGGVFTVSGGSNSAATVSQSTAGTATLGATSSAGNAATCLNSSTGAASCAMLFSDSGLVISAPDHVSMSTASVTIQALKAAAAPNAGKSCVPLVANARVAVGFGCKYNDPASAASVPFLLKDKSDAGYTSVACGSGTSNVALAFDGAGLATANLQYAEVGNVGLRAAYSAGSTGASSDGYTAFTVAPASFKIVATRNATTSQFDKDRGIFARASEPFTIAVSAVNAKGDVTTNYGQESTKEFFKYDTKVTTPETGVGTLSGTFKPFDKGVSTNNAFSFDDTGTITVAAKSAQSSEYYMNVAKDGFKTQGTLVIGRFIPDHFDTTLPTPAAPYDPAQINGVAMTCADAPAIAPCVDRLIYANQPFYVMVKAYNGASPAKLTQNYTGTQAKEITLSSWTKWDVTPAAPVPSKGTPPVPAGGMAWSGSQAQGFSFSGGVGVTAAANLPYFAFPADNALQGPTQFYLRAVDTDGVSSLRSQAGEQALTAVVGRVFVPNTYGSATSPMPMRIQAQYYSSTLGGYLLNPAYNSVGLSLAALTYRNCQNALDVSGNKTFVCAAAPIEPREASTQFIKGIAQFRFNPPKAPYTGKGSVEVLMQSPPGASPANAPLVPYLPSTAGRQTFGIYRSGPVIYTRELY